MKTSMEYCWHQRWRWLWIWMGCLFTMSEVLEEQPSISLRISWFLRDSYMFLETSNVSEEFRLHFPLRCLEYRSLLANTTYSTTFDLEGMAKFILDMHLSMYREKWMSCRKGVWKFVPLWGATWHWCDLTFIEPSVVKLDYGKVSASDLSSFDIALWYKSCKRWFEISTCESEWIYTELELLWIQFEALFSFETMDECFQKHSLDSWVGMMRFHRSRRFLDSLWECESDGDGFGISVSILDVASTSEMFVKPFDYLLRVCEILRHCEDNAYV